MGDVLVDVIGDLCSRPDGGKGLIIALVPEENFIALK